MITNNINNRIVDYSVSANGMIIVVDNRNYEFKAAPISAAEMLLHCKNKIIDYVIVKSYDFNQSINQSISQSIKQSLALSLTHIKRYFILEDTPR